MWNYAKFKVSAGQHTTRHPKKRSNWDREKREGFARCCKPNIANRKLEVPLHLLEDGEQKNPKVFPTLPSTRWAHLESSTLTERFQGRAMKENIVPQMFFVLLE